jgi:hypothetical protein
MNYSLDCHRDWRIKMPYEITFKDLPAGCAISSGRKGENVTVATREFTSSEDGDLFINRLEGFPSDIIRMLPPESKIKSSVVDHMLVIIRQDKTATVYVNEIVFLAEVVNKGRDMEAGQPVYTDDIADVRKLSFKDRDLQDIIIPPDAGVLFLFSEGWRKGFYYDLKPFAGGNPEPRDYDLEMLCGQFYAYLGFQHLFKISEDEWNRLIAQQWFPFISLKNRTIQEIVNYARNNWEIDELTDRIANELAEMIPALLSKWEKNKLFESHFALFKQAAERFLEKDYISATAILYPRIEGLMRTYHMASNQSLKPTQKNLVTSVVDAKATERHGNSLLLPNNFRRYLEEVYFASFDPNDPKILSRHTVSHGVAPAENFSLKGAIIGLLILDQLSFYIGSQEES